MQNEEPDARVEITRVVFFTIPWDNPSCKQSVDLILVVYGVLFCTVQYVVHV